MIEEIALRSSTTERPVTQNAAYYALLGAAIDIGGNDANCLGFRRHFEGASTATAPTFTFYVANNLDQGKGCGVTDAVTQANPMAEVAEYIEANDLEAVLTEAKVHLNAAFGDAVKPEYRLMSDPSDGRLMLHVVIPVADRQEGEGRLTAFCYDWWFNKLGSFGHLVGFRVVKARGV